MWSQTKMVTVSNRKDKKGKGEREKCCLWQGGEGEMLREARERPKLKSSGGYGCCPDGTFFPSSPISSQVSPFKKLPMSHDPIYAYSFHHSHQQRVQGRLFQRE